MSQEMVHKITKFYEGIQKPKRARRKKHPFNSTKTSLKSAKIFINPVKRRVKVKKISHARNKNFVIRK
eukprot:CAMPEP_0197008514 /NCGR_PEP_ID=MMETSP1380-20130617/45614_1 /TAXON_ID=5936 /ORGANISM="Euplotes crassus, Strain CT5" /LENGTH=67 /DNA_ID=CAMNT_0042429145 /DNA_START=9 /DNA_END=212 /DNA_ORIENTATION=+